MNVVAPRPAPPERPGHALDGRSRYDWSKVQVGVWQNWLQLDDSCPDADARRLSQNIIVAGRDWASRRGLRLKTRRYNLGRVVDLLFTDAEV